MFVCTVHALGSRRRGIRAVVRRTCHGCDIGRYATASQSDTGAVYFCDDCETGRYMDVAGVSDVTQAVCERRSHDEQSRSHVNAHL